MEIFGCYGQVIMHNVLAIPEIPKIQLKKVFDQNNIQNIMNNNTHMKKRNKIKGGYLTWLPWKRRANIANRKIFTP